MFTFVCNNSNYNGRIMLEEHEAFHCEQNEGEKLSRLLMEWQVLSIVMTIEFIYFEWTFYCDNSERLMQAFEKKNLKCLSTKATESCVVMVLPFGRNFSHRRMKAETACSEKQLDGDALKPQTAQRALTFNLHLWCVQSFWDALERFFHFWTEQILQPDNNCKCELKFNARSRKFSFLHAAVIKFMPQHTLLRQRAAKKKQSGCENNEEFGCEARSRVRGRRTIILLDQERVCCAFEVVDSSHFQQLWINFPSRAKRFWLLSQSRFQARFVLINQSAGSIATISEKAENWLRRVNQPLACHHKSNLYWVFECENSPESLVTFLSIE